jgi:methyltransferase (TIGR00027 family)
VIAVNQTVVSNVSDTARWVAAYRAIESARPDAKFSDPFADRLAGPRGHAMAQAAPRLIMGSGATFVARTKLIDDLIARSIAEGCDRVLNLAAGLDTRPYRLDLPSTLEWIEADLPAMVEEKDGLLDGEVPRCQLVRHGVDLADPVERDAFIGDAISGADNVLVLTEGLLMYLDEGQVRALSHDLYRDPIMWWVTDLLSPAVRTLMTLRLRNHFRNAPVQFAPADGVAFFEPDGWAVEDLDSLMKTAARWKRLPPLARPVGYLPDPDPRDLKWAPWTGVVRFKR